MPRTTRRFTWNPDATPEQIAAYLQSLPPRQRMQALRAAGRPTVTSSDRQTAVNALRTQAAKEA